MADVMPPAVKPLKGLSGVLKPPEVKVPGWLGRFLPMIDGLLANLQSSPSYEEIHALLSRAQYLEKIGKRDAAAWWYGQTLDALLRYGREGAQFKLSAHCGLARIKIASNNFLGAANELVDAAGAAKDAAAKQECVSACLGLLDNLEKTKTDYLGIAHIYLLLLQIGEDRHKPLFAFEAAKAYESGGKNDAALDEALYALKLLSREEPDELFFACTDLAKKIADSVERSSDPIPTKKCVQAEIYFAIACEARIRDGHDTGGEYARRALASWSEAASRLKTMEGAALLGSFVLIKCLQNFSKDKNDVRKLSNAHASIEALVRFLYLLNFATLRKLPLIFSPNTI